MNIFLYAETYYEHGIVIDCQKREVSCILVRAIATGTVGPVSI